MFRQLFILSFIVALGFGSCGSALAGQAGKEKALEQSLGKDISELSHQELIDVYSVCISVALHEERKHGKKNLSLGDLRQTCKEERKSLSFKWSQQAVNAIDDFILSQFNQYQD